MSNSTGNLKPKLVIIGAGVAGLTAGLMAGRNRLATVIFEAKTPGGRAGGIPYIESYPGLGKVKGTEFIKTLKQQLSNLDCVEVHEFEPVKEIRINNDFFNIITDKQDYIFQYVIFAMGAEHKLLEATGETEFKGRGVSYCAACDGLFFKNKNTIVVGNDTHAVEQALFLAELGSIVTLITSAANLDAEPKLCNELEKTSVNVLFDTNVEEIYGERLVGGVRINTVSPETPGKSDQETQEMETKGVFISVGLVPRTELIKGLGMDLTQDGYIKVNGRFQTNVPNLYAVGDLTALELELISVCASGANAVKSILDYL